MTITSLYTQYDSYYYLLIKIYVTLISNADVRFYFSNSLLIIRYRLIVISERHCMSHRYISGRGGSQRATLPLVGPKDVQEAQRKMTPNRSRRTGLLTVTERPPGKRSWNAQWFVRVLVIRSHPKKKKICFLLCLMF